MYRITWDHPLMPRWKTEVQVRRLRDFKAHNLTYYVRTAKRDKDSLQRIYKGVDGKLTPTDGTVRFHKWGMKTFLRAKKKGARSSQN